MGPGWDGLASAQAPLPDPPQHLGITLGLRILPGHGYHHYGRHRILEMAPARQGSMSLGPDRGRGLLPAGATLNPIWKVRNWEVRGTRRGSTCEGEWA